MAQKGKVNGGEYDDVDIGNRLIVSKRHVADTH
jgi:hypothetical protein